MNGRPCPLWGDMIVDCEQIPTGVGKISLPCHFYNANARHCVLFDISENLRDIPQALTMLSLGLGPKKPPRVLFTDIEEYLSEINADKDMIYRGIVRVTKTIASTAPKSTGVYQMRLLSSYAVQDQLIKFEHYYGFFTTVEPGGRDQASSAVDDDIQKIKTLCLDLLLEARAGVLEMKDPRPPIESVNITG